MMLGPILLIGMVAALLFAVVLWGLWLADQVVAARTRMRWVATRHRRARLDG